jgi:hypothetical protein
MLRNKGDNMLDEKVLNRQEAIYFLDCMYTELYRHQRLAREAHISSITNLNTPTKTQFWRFGEERHLEDCTMIIKTIDYLEDKFELKERSRYV